MKTNLKKLITAILAIAMVFAMAIPAAAAEIPVHYDDDMFLWDDENPHAVIEFFENIDSLLGLTQIQDEEVPMSAAPETVRVPVHYDDDLFLWDDENPHAVIEFFENIDSLLGLTQIQDEEVPMSAAPETIRVPVLYDDDMFLWDDENPLAVVEFLDNLLN